MHNNANSEGSARELWFRFLAGLIANTILSGTGKRKIFLTMFVYGINTWHG
jgi:hypothetical protein